MMFVLLRIVKHSSPTLNYVIVAGALCMYASVIVYLAPTTFYATVQITCQVKVLDEQYLLHIYHHFLTS